MTTPFSSIGSPRALPATVPPPATPAPAAAGGGDGGLRKAAVAFEAVILRQLLSSMRSAKLGEDIFGSSATDNFREMADAKLADSMASLRQFGIADLVEAQLRGRAASGGGAVQ